MPFRESRFLICWRMWSLRAISRLTRISINSPPASPNAGKESEPLPVSKRNKAAEKTAAVQDASRSLERGISEDIQLVYDAFAVSSAAATKRQKRQPQSKTLRDIWSVESARTFNLFMTLVP